MQQLTGVDATFLNMETPTQQGHVGGVVIVDPATAPAALYIVADRLAQPDGAWTRFAAPGPYRRIVTVVPGVGATG